MPTDPSPTLHEQLPEYLEKVRVFLESNSQITDHYIRAIVHGAVAIVVFVIFCGVVYFLFSSWARKRQLLIKLGISLTCLSIACLIAYKLVLLKFGAITWDQSIGEYSLVARYAAGSFFAALVTLHIFLFLVRFGARKFANRGS